MKSTILSLIVLMALVGCASTNYSEFHGAKVMEGTGGTMEQVDGIDIWANGTPDRKYIVLGIVDDVRASGPIPMAGLKKGLAEKAKAQGGQAVIMYGQGDTTTGLTAVSTTTGPTTVTGVYEMDGSHATKAAVIKYVN